MKDFTIGSVIGLGICIAIEWMISNKSIFV